MDRFIRRARQRTVETNDASEFRRPLATVVAREPCCAPGFADDEALQKFLRRLTVTFALNQYLFAYFV